MDKAEMKKQAASLWQSLNFEVFLSVFTWRYTSLRMRHMWSEVYKRKKLRQVWLAMAFVKWKINKITEEQYKDIEAHAEDIDIETALAKELDSGHDLDAECQTFAEQCPVGGHTIHQGATSACLTDNADMLIVTEAYEQIRQRLAKLIKTMTSRLDGWSHIVTIGRSHLMTGQEIPWIQRFGQYIEQLNIMLGRLDELELRTKGFKGAMGTGADYEDLLEGTGVSLGEFEQRILDRLGMYAFDVTGQIYPRRQDLSIVNLFNEVAVTLHTFASDTRLLQMLGLSVEPKMSEKQRASSVMFFKRNPRLTEQLCGIAAYIGCLVPMAQYAASNSLLERTLNESSIRRLYLPHMFLALDHCLCLATFIADGIEVYEDAVESEWQAFSEFASTGRLNVKLADHEIDRSEVYDLLREASEEAAKRMRTRQPIQLAKEILGALQKATIKSDKGQSFIAGLDEAGVHELISCDARLGNSLERIQNVCDEVEITTKGISEPPDDFVLL